MTPPPLPLPPNPRILIVRLSAIGDTVHSLPLAAALRWAFPDSHLGWIVEKPSAPLIENNPLLDWVKILPKGWLKSPALVRELRRDAKRERFDIAIDVQGLTKSAVAAWLSGAKRRIGFPKGEARELAPWLTNIAVTPRGRHAVDRTLSLLDGLGIHRTGAAEFVFPPCPENDRAAIDATLAADVFSNGFVLMGPWGSFASKLWPLDRFLELAKRIRRETGLPSLMLGHGDAERGRVAPLAAEAPDALSAAPDVSLPGVVELARRATAFVGCDSFPMHASAGAGTPTLGLFGITDPERLGPYGPNGRAAFHAITLVKSTRERRRLGPENMERLTADAVLKAFLDLLKHS